MRSHRPPSFHRIVAAGEPHPSPYRQLGQKYQALPRAAIARPRHDGHRRTDVPKKLNHSLALCRYCSRWVRHHVLHMVSVHRHDPPIPPGRPLTGCSACGRFTLDIDTHQQIACVARAVRSGP